MGRRNNLIDPIEVEVYEGSDYLVLGITVVAVIISICLIIWTPDVEAIGNWVWTTIM